MKRKFLRYLFKKYNSIFAEFVVRDFYEEMPNKITEPVMDFFYNNRSMLERYFTSQAYWIAQRSIGDPTKQQFYNGILFYIKTLIALSQKGRIKKEEVEIKEPEKDPLSGVKDFVKGFGEINKKKE